MRRWCYAMLFILAALPACVMKNVLIPSPVMFQDGAIDPFTGMPEQNHTTSVQVFYATHRQPMENPKDPPFYGNSPDANLRVGTATVQIGEDGATWAQLREQSLSSSREQEPSLRVIEANEFGALSYALQAPRSSVDIPVEVGRATSQFAAGINAELARSRRKDVYIYVPGYRVDFTHATTVSAAFAHFFSREGVFLAYSWPTGLQPHDYFAARESAEKSVRLLRHLLQFIAAETQVRRIHLVGFSTGARIVKAVLAEFNLLHYNDDEATIHDTVKIGNVILTGSDISLMLTQSRYKDRVDDVAGSITIYTSNQDTVLDTSRWLWGTARLGTLTASDLEESKILFLQRDLKTNIIDVTTAKKAEQLGGHWYFLMSPWVSTDVLLNLKFGLSPAERGLVREEGHLFWTFPSNYPTAVREVGARFYGRGKLDDE